jgi:ergothioneine biosynthesis protein EgtB
VEPDASPLARYRAIRSTTEWLIDPLSAEDCAIQSMPDMSPAKWHLGHTTWFFETMILESTEAGFRPFDASFRVLFNSYYNTVGEQHPRPRRGMLSRPGLDRVRQYRSDVDRRMERPLRDGTLPEKALSALEVGLNHEQQHQELLLMDVKHLFSCNPLRPTYRPLEEPPATDPGDLTWSDFPGGSVAIGHEGNGFAFDNERPRHEILVQPFSLANRPVTCGEYLEFMADGGYRRPELWLSDGWEVADRHGWEAPLYWERDEDGTWSLLTLHGPRPVRGEEPVVHVSYYEADAFARWAGARLPQEAEWETAATSPPGEGHFLEGGSLHPAPVAPADDGSPVQLFGDVWEWTGSAYGPYPGYRPPEGALGEYNGKFMCNQMVMRGGAVVTPASHIRRTYRNFFYPHMRWQFGGIRLAR